MFDPTELARWDRTRCPNCGWHRRTQGHSPGCPSGWCRHCKQFGSWLNTKRCLWCLDKEKKAATSDGLAREGNI